MSKISIFSLYIMILYILLLICIISLFYKVESFENTFLHVPKTGGSSVVEFLRQYDFELLGHEGSIEKNTVLIIREPIDRFKSSFKYWKQNCIADNTCDESVTVSDFIENIKKNNAVLNTTHTWDVHYLPQSKYIDETKYKNAIVIRYCDRMEDKLHLLLQYLNIENKHIELNHVNQSQEYPIHIQYDDLSWIMDYYKNDFDLWNKLKNNPELFLKVI